MSILFTVCIIIDMIILLSGGALAIGVGDKIVMLENSIYSILSPEGFASILYKDSSKAKQAAENMKITAKDLKKLNIIDDIIKEPTKMTKEDFENVAKSIKKYLIKNIEELQKLKKTELLNQRYKKFRNM